MSIDRSIDRWRDERSVFLPDVFATEEHPKCQRDHIVRVLSIVLHGVQGQSHVRMAVVAAEVMLNNRSGEIGAASFFTLFRYHSFLVLVGGLLHRLVPDRSNMGRIRGRWNSNQIQLKVFRRSTEGHIILLGEMNECLASADHPTNVRTRSKVRQNLE